jgi:membrane associated rhomboid family serine protease
MPYTYIIIAVTTLISIGAFNNYQLFEQWKHWPYAEARRNQGYRMLTGGFLHGDYGHLILNMLTLYFFGPLLEQFFSIIIPEAPKIAFVAFYVLAIVAASYATFVKHKDNPGFASIGASGATAAVLFACILFAPTIGIMMFFIPIPIPGFIFGIFYLWYSARQAQQGTDNIDHLAHYFGAIFGFVFPLIFQPSLAIHFFEQISGWFTHLF